MRIVYDLASPGTLNTTEMNLGENSQQLVGAETGVSNFIHGTWKDCLLAETLESKLGNGRDPRIADRIEWTSTLPESLDRNSGLCGLESVTVLRDH